MLAGLGGRGASLHDLSVAGVCRGELGEGCRWSREPWSGVRAWGMGQADWAIEEANLAAAYLGIQPTPLGSIQKSPGPCNLDLGLASPSCSLEPSC